jgi:predicted DNA-binding transcriptional regulator YafY
LNEKFFNLEMNLMTSYLASAQKLQTRPPLSRMILIHDLLKQNRLPNRQTLAQELETSAKTIQRDIDFMRDQLGLPIEYDGAKFGYYYTQPVESFPTHQFSEQEIRGLLVARRILTMHVGSPFEKEWSTAFQKLLEGRGVREDGVAGSFEDYFSFRTYGEEKIDPELFHILSRGMIEHKEIEFEYCKLAAEGFQKRRVQPLHLASVHHKWYLFAKDCGHGEIRSFALSRMKTANVTTTQFQIDKSFEIEKFLEDSFGVNGNSGKYKVQIWFDALAAKLVKEKLWHKSQKIKELPNGEIELKMTLGSLKEVKRWVLMWGEGC